MEEYKMTLKSHLDNGWLIFLGLIIGLNGGWLYKKWRPNSDPDAGSIGGIGVIVMFVLPTVVVHVNYYLVNRGDIVRYWPSEGVIEIYHRRVTTTFKIDDIEKMVRSMSCNKFANRSGVAPWEEYSHVVLFLKNGKRFTITSLLINDLTLPIEDEKVFTKQNFYRLAKNYS
ncbi:hypothetical protein [Pedobacter faecalis]|uniref:hypothetical protein n=1 Tax=Pedobacter faecalis TaxID=3041495 RepID=UPI00254ED8EF|nr:hypothetical protein [Pedobacter sp. ELA7]